MTTIAKPNRPICPRAESIRAFLSDLVWTDPKHLTEGERSVLDTLSSKTLEMATAIMWMASDLTAFDSIEKVRLVEKDGAWRWVEEGDVTRISGPFEEARVAAADYLDLVGHPRIRRP